MTRPVNFRAGPGDPCPVCREASKGCSATDDGLHFCRGTPGPDWRETPPGGPDRAGFRHYRREGDRLRHSSPLRLPQAEKPGARPRPAQRWAARSAQYAENLADNEPARRLLAKRLGLPATSFGALAGRMGCIPFDPGGACWTFTETDADGNPIGILRRRLKPNGGPRYQALQGSRRGLTIPTDDSSRPGPVYAVEGATDVLALAACGLRAIGRPSNCGVDDLLAAFVKKLPAGVPVYVVGENDRKADGSWPGREGAEQTARTLAEKTGRAVFIAYPPDGAKDAREWVKAATAGPIPDYATAGSLWSAELDAGKVVVSPPGGRVDDPERRRSSSSDHPPLEEPRRATPLPRPRCPYGVAIVLEGIGTNANRGAVVRPPCNCHGCATCGPYMRNQFKLNLLPAVAGHAGQVSVWEGPADELAALCAHVRRAAGKGNSPKRITVKVGGGSVFAVFFDAPRTPRLDQVEPRDGAARLSEALDNYPAIGGTKSNPHRPVYASPGLLPREEKEDPAWRKVGPLRASVREGAELLEGHGIKPTADPDATPEAGGGPALLLTWVFAPDFPDETRAEVFAALVGRAYRAGPPPDRPPTLGDFDDPPDERRAA
jgi:hypothetical protein